MAGREDIIIISANATDPCPLDVTGVSQDTCSTITNATKSDITSRIYAVAPTYNVVDSTLPTNLKNKLDTCVDGTCNFVSYDFDTDTGTLSGDMSYVINTRSTTTENRSVILKKKQATISAISGDGSTVTVTTTTDHNFTVGGTVNLSVSPYAGEFIIENVTSPTTFTYASTRQLCDDGFAFQTDGTCMKTEDYPVALFFHPTSNGGRGASYISCKEPGLDGIYTRTPITAYGTCSDRVTGSAYTDNYPVGMFSHPTATGQSTYMSCQEPVFSGPTTRNPFGRTGSCSDTVTYTPSAPAITADSKVTYVPTAPVSFSAPPGYTYLSSAIDGTQITSKQQTSGASQVSCASTCDSDTTCQGFNFSSIGENCELFSTISTNSNVATSKVSFRKEIPPVSRSYLLPYQYKKNASGKDCQNATQCNIELNKILKNLVMNGIKYFSTNDIPSCAYCPPRTMNIGPTLFTITAEFGFSAFGTNDRSAGFDKSFILYEDTGENPNYIVPKNSKNINFQLFKFIDIINPLFTFKFDTAIANMTPNSTKKAIVSYETLLDSTSDYVAMKKTSDSSYISFVTYNNTANPQSTVTASVFKFIPVPYVENGFYIYAKYNTNNSSPLWTHTPDIQYYKNDFTLSSDIPGLWHESQDFIFIVRSQCTGGQYLALPSGTCTTCPAGYYCLTGTVYSTPCPAGTYSSTVGASTHTTCLQCPLYKYCPSGTSTPMNCTAGSEILKFGASSCTLCSSGTSTPGQPCCPPGYTFTNNQCTKSVSCGTGFTYYDQSGVQGCTNNNNSASACPTGTTKSPNGLVCFAEPTCTGSVCSCPTGTNLGTYAPTNTTKCLSTPTCPTGSSLQTSGICVVPLCPVGYTLSNMTCSKYMCPRGYTGLNCAQCDTNFTWNGTVCEPCLRGGTGGGSASGVARACTCTGVYGGDLCERVPCTASAPYTVPGSSDCVAQCPASMPYWVPGSSDSRICVQACPSDTPFIQPGVGQLCTSQCGTMFRDGNTCVQSCPADKPYGNSVTGSVVYECLQSCPATKSYYGASPYGGTVCATQCSDFGSGWYTNNKECVKTCPASAKYVLDGVCSSSCGGTKPYIDGVICVSSCPAIRPFIDETGKCTNYCPFYVNLNFCVTTCPASRPYIGDYNACVTSCPKYRDGTTCVYTCPSTKAIISAGVCQTACPLGQVADLFWDGLSNKYVYMCAANCSNSGLTSNHGMCTSSCTPPEFADVDSGGQKYCTSTCPAAKPYLDTYRYCVASCSPRYIAVDGKSCIDLCPSGSFLNPAKTACINQCPANYYVYTDPYMQDKRCTICPAGKSSAAGSSSCSDCPSGQTSTSGSNCSNCPAGQYSSAAGSSSCSVCAAGTYSDAGASSCLSCPAGKKCPVGTGKTQTNCAAGTYSSGGAGDSCTSCAAGTYSSGGASSCMSCPAGKKCPVGTGKTQTDCAAGTYSSGGAGASCASCAAGRYSAAGASSCLSCPAGSSSSLGSSSCSVCSGLSVSISGGTCVKTCPSGYYTSGRQCLSSCPVYIDSGSCVSVCSSGKYILSQTCTSCSAGTYSASTTATSCTTCPAGKKCPAGTGSTQSDCDAGTYSTGGAGDSCTSCSAGSYSGAGASSCTTCPAGKKCPAGTGSTQSDCDAGTYSTGGAGDSCTSCSSGWYTTSTGSTACTQCPAGQSCPTTSGNPVDCAAGTYSVAGAPSCTSCPGGTSFAGSRGTTSSVCTPCIAGTYSTAGSSTCSPCPDYLVSAVGQSSCTTGCDFTRTVRFRNACLTTCPNGYYPYSNECTFNIPNCEADSSCGASISGKCSVNITGVPPGCTVCPGGRKLDNSGDAYCNTGTSDLCTSTSGNGVGGYCAACPYGQLGFGMASTLCSTPAKTCPAGYYISSTLEGSIPVCTRCQENSISTSDFSSCTLCPRGQFLTTYAYSRRGWYPIIGTGCAYPTGTVIQTLSGATYAANVPMWLDGSHTYATLNGTAIQCAAKCNADYGCTGFERAYDVADTTVTPCYFTKSIHNNVSYSSGTVSWSLLYRSFIRPCKGQGEMIQIDRSECCSGWVYSDNYDYLRCG